MSEDQHESDVADKVPHHPDGGCLNRHVGDPPCDSVDNPCSHRWQAYEKMKATKSLYNWPKYKSLTDAGVRRRTARLRAGSGDMFPKYYRTYLDPPAKGDWNVKGKNFFVKCYDPYWHEAHHVVPNSTLRGAIADLGDCAIAVRRGLAKEKYNLNDKKNMIMLPMDKPVSMALELPRHRKTATVRSHKGYSNMVSRRLKAILQPLADRIEAHEARKYDSVKSDIEALSEELFNAIKSSEAGALDEMGKDEMGLKPKTSTF
ncbi:MAG TPA: AHH domain-containing protein [Gammaproteobacteria bacterium]|nr:AHH domain-containing protein [Gammaproteobacteria bacterium]